MALQNLEKSCSLMWCHTAERGALMTADSRTEVEVGMAVEEDIVTSYVGGEIESELVVLLLLRSFVWTQNCRINVVLAV